MPYCCLFFYISLLITGRLHSLRGIPVSTTTYSSNNRGIVEKKNGTVIKKKKRLILVISDSSLINDMDIFTLGEVNLPVRSSSIHSTPE